MFQTPVTWLIHVMDFIRTLNPFTCFTSTFIHYKHRCIFSCQLVNATSESSSHRFEWIFNRCSVFCDVIQSIASFLYHNVKIVELSLVNTILLFCVQFSSRGVFLRFFFEFPDKCPFLWKSVPGYLSIYTKNVNEVI